MPSSTCQYLMMRLFLGASVILLCGLVSHNSHLHAACKTGRDPYGQNKSHNSLSTTSTIDCCFFYLVVVIYLLICGMNKMNSVISMTIATRTVSQSLILAYIVVVCITPSRPLSSFSSTHKNMWNCTRQHIRLLTHHNFSQVHAQIHAKTSSDPPNHPGLQRLSSLNFDRQFQDF